MQDETSAHAGPRQMLVVAGSGRSGTSLFTGLTGRLGVYIPKPEVSANRSNPRGFGEPRWLVDYHNDLLSSVDVVVEDGRPEAWELTSGTADKPEVLDGLVTWLDEQFAENHRIVVKDPRLAWFFELHRAAAARLSRDPRRHHAAAPGQGDALPRDRLRHQDQQHHPHDRLADDDARDRVAHPRPAARDHPATTTSSSTGSPH